MRSMSASFPSSSFALSIASSSILISFIGPPLLGNMVQRHSKPAPADLLCRTRRGYCAGFSFRSPFSEIIILIVIIIIEVEVLIVPVLLIVRISVEQKDPD